jgi:sec-independent protein translocase protein TatA
MSLGLPEIILIAIVVLLLFGGKRIPELAKALGRANYEYKKAKDLIKKETEEIKNEIEQAEPQNEEVKSDNV